MDIKPDTENILRVWERVAPGAEEKAAEPDGEALRAASAAAMRRFMDGEASAAAEYASMASRCRQGGAARLFRELAEACGARLGRLQAVYFLLCGDTYAPEKERAGGPLLAAARRRRAGRRGGGVQGKRRCVPAERRVAAIAAWAHDELDETRERENPFRASAGRKSFSTR